LYKKMCVNKHSMAVLEKDGKGRKREGKKRGAEWATVSIRQYKRKKRRTKMFNIILKPK